MKKNYLKQYTFAQIIVLKDEEARYNISRIY